MDITGDPRLRNLVADIAELDPEPEVRDAAHAALAGDDAAIMTFLSEGEDVARAAANARKADTARRDKTAVEALTGTGGPIFNAEVTRVLAGTDGDRAEFLAYGKDVAKLRDEQNVRAARELADQLRSRVSMLTSVGGVEVRRAAQVALEAGDAAIAEFLRSGYAAAAKLDAAAREAYIKELDERNKAADALSDLAKKAARASTARRNLLVAHGTAVRALQRVSNALINTATQARQAEQILAANAAGGQHPPSAFDVVKAEAARQVGYAVQAAAEAQQASASATIEANVLVETGLTYGTQWAQMAQGMEAATRAATGAAQTAQHAIDATAAVDAARDAADKAVKHAEQARQWRLHAEEHARAAASVAESARVQAVAAQDAAARAKAARVAAEQAEQQAWAAAARTREQRLIAEREQGKAAAARAIAEQERGKAADARGRADAQAKVAADARGQADAQAAVAAGARARAEEQDRIAGRADVNAHNEEANAAGSRDRAVAAEQAQRVAEAKAQALEAAAAHARGGPYAQQAQDAANQARAEANTATNAAIAARAAANNATAAAALARAAATEATRAAARARAAAADAQAAAARATQAARQAEVEAAATHAFAQQSNVKAAEATVAEAQAAEASQAATRLAEQAASEAQQSLLAANRTKAEADAASAESVSAATQAGIAVKASLAARASSAGIIEPANTAINIVAPFTGSDVNADFVVVVAEQARAVGAEQARAAEQRAAEAGVAAQRAADAAARAAAEVKPAYDAAAAAAASAAAASRSAAEAQAAAAAAAIDGAAARDAGARANQADAQARGDAAAARVAANAANNDAAIAGRNATAAEAEAAAARDAASRAEADAAAARDAASRAEADAAAARAAAASAQQHADNAAKAAENAKESASEGQKAADRAEEAARKAEEEARRKAHEENSQELPDLTPDEVAALSSSEEGRKHLEEYRQAQHDSANGGGVTAFLVEIGAEVILEVIGWRDAQRCFGEGDIESCLWTVLNVASVVSIFLKLPSVTAAVVKIVKNIFKFASKSEKFRSIFMKARKVLDFLWKWCKRLGSVPSVKSKADLPDFTCGLMDYDGGGMASVAVEARYGTGYGENGRNVAVAYVSGWVNADGKYPNMVIGFSGQGGNSNYHSEDHILDQLRGAGRDVSQIEAVYSERQPCPVCEDKLVRKLKAGAKVSFSVPWGSDGELNKLYSKTLNDYIKRAFFRRGWRSSAGMVDAAAPSEPTVVGAPR
ncbi:nucleic acid/nucleotide deaminase domain-containing protein [Amycolatopsis sp. NPDC059657]|uniref:nucleic acid/nucleotide deaminase domain-containing protein n=1 Tax=Amycolatopsis sp. NPDC059657 TaxID=3346899 RepID=UPI00366E1E57